jgi:hypothetical protein
MALLTSLMNAVATRRRAVLWVPWKPFAETLGEAKARTMAAVRADVALIISAAVDRSAHGAEAD